MQFNELVNIYIEVGIQRNTTSIVSFFLRMPLPNSKQYREELRQYYRIERVVKLPK